MYGGVTGGGAPILNIGVTVRNDYTSADLGGAIGNRTGSYISSVNLDIRFYCWNGSIIEVPKAKGVAAPTVSSNTALGESLFFWRAVKRNRSSSIYPLLRQTLTLLTITKSSSHRCPLIEKR